MPNTGERTIHKGHYRMCAQLHFNICQEIGVKLDNEHWYDYVPKSAETSREVKETILWIPQVQAYTTSPNNKPDIVFRDNERGTCVLVDVTNSGNINVIKKAAEKILKCKELII